jgi:hypothetical protein
VFSKPIRFWRPAVPDAASQNGRIKRTFPGFKLVRSGRSLAWLGELAPRPGSKYAVLIKYRGTKSPTVFLLDPEVDPRCPHIYPNDNSLCLYWPLDPENPGWKADSWIADTIIPWAAVWLHYYELWLETGEWMGPEKVHSTNIRN